MEELIAAGGIDEPFFSTFFRPDDSGFVEFGGEPDDSLRNGDFTQVPVANGTDGSWTVSQISFGSGSTTFPGGAIDVLFDTGGSGLDIPQDALNAYFGLVDGSQQDDSGSWTYPCGGQLADFNLIFSNAINGPGTITVPGDALKSGDGTDRCGTWMGTANGRGSGGLPVFISQYIVWDQATPTLSFAPQAAR